MNVMLIVAVVVAVVDFIMELLAVALPYWFTVGSGSTKIYYGLWEICQSVNNDDYVCRSFDSANVDVDAWYEAVEAMMLIGFFFLLFAVVLGICLIACLEDRGILYILAGAFAIFSALCSFIGIVVFGVKSEDDFNLDGDQLHAAFYLAIFGCCLAIVTGILFFLAKPKMAHTQFH